MPGRADEGIDSEVKPIIIKVINTFKHDSRAFIEQRLIDNLVGLGRKSESTLEAYIHTDLIDKFIDWLNGNNPEMAEKWEAIALDASARLAFREFDNLYPLVIGRTKVGYVRGSERQAFYQNVLSQLFTSRFIKTLSI